MSTPHFLIDRSWSYSTTNYFSFQITRDTDTYSWEYDTTSVTAHPQNAALITVRSNNGPGTDFSWAVCTTGGTPASRAALLAAMTTALANNVANNDYWELNGSLFGSPAWTDYVDQTGVTTVDRCRFVFAKSTPNVLYIDGDLIAIFRESDTTAYPHYLCSRINTLTPQPFLSADFPYSTTSTGDQVIGTAIDLYHGIWNGVYSLRVTGSATAMTLCFFFRRASDSVMLSDTYTEVSLPASTTARHSVTKVCNFGITSTLGTAVSHEFCVRQNAVSAAGTTMISRHSVGYSSSITHMWGRFFFKRTE